MEMDLDPTPPPVNAAVAAAAATPPPSQPEPASPCPVPSPREDASPIPVSPPDGSPARARRSKRPRAAPADEGPGPTATPRRKRRGAREPRATGGGAAAASSPGKKVRRARLLGREEAGKEAVEEEEGVGKTRRRKAPARALKAKGSVVAVKEKGSRLALVPCPPTNSTRGAENEGLNGWEDFWEMAVDLIMWKNVARSAFWFGSGSMLIVSSTFSREINVSPISVGCQFGVVILGIAFLKDSFLRREQGGHVSKLQLTEEDVRRAAQAVLPVANILISGAQLLFSGDPSMTLKVLPVLLFGAKFGHLLTIRRILATGFFSCFTLPKLYSCYSRHVHAKAKGLKDQIVNAWKSCPRKKLVSAVAVTTCWNLFSVKTRIMAAFFCAVTLSYYYRYCRGNSGLPREAHGSRGEEQAMVTEE
ncbi:hypothetical protein ACP70R_048278 [Stipagrostis hirtigluma subsp. patula]